MALCRPRWPTIIFSEALNCALVVIDGAHSLAWSRSTAKAD